MTTHVSNKEQAKKLSELIEYYEVCNRAEGKSPKTITWYSANLRHFRSYLKNRHLPDSLDNIMGARFGKLYSRNLIDKDISFIPDNLDLITMPNQNWNLCKQMMKDPLQDLLNLPGVACAVLTKAIHRKRPNLIPVCDAIVVEDVLGTNSGKKNANTILMVMEKLRDVGQKNLQALQHIRDF